jgi:hypothetical protein
VGLGVRAKGKPGEVVFKQEEHIGTYCGVLLQLDLWFGTDAGVFLLDVKGSHRGMSINAKGYGNFTRFFGHAEGDACNMAAMESHVPLVTRDGCVTLHPCEFWSTRDIVAGR